VIERHPKDTMTADAADDATLAEIRGVPVREVNWNIATEASSLLRMN